MEDLVSVTYARNNLKKLISQAVTKGKTFILLKNSQPQVAIVPYEEILASKRNWQEEFECLRTQAQPYFDRWLANKSIKKSRLTEKKLDKLLDEKD